MGWYRAKQNDFNGTDDDPDTSNFSTYRTKGTRARAENVTRRDIKGGITAGVIRGRVVQDRDGNTWIED